jgi:hypothetical protein
MMYEGVGCLSRAAMLKDGPVAMTTAAGLSLFRQARLAKIRFARHALGARTITVAGRLTR